MTGHGAKFGRKKEEAIIALLTHRNVEEAAKAVDLAPKTLFRWLQIPEFDADYRKARRDSFRQSVARLQQASSAAVTTLLKLAVDQSACLASTTFTHQRQLFLPISDNYNLDDVVMV